MEEVRGVARKAMALAAVGGAFGAGLAVYRGHSAAMYSVSIGGNYLVLAGTVLGMEKVVSYINGKSSMSTHAVSGFVGGGFLSGVFGGPRLVLPGAVLFAGIASAGYAGTNKIVEYL
uniref:Uncharacterized protein n=1 Tax=Rhizochromulina marina TaxID=1034831 RepID=A0A6U1CAX6_9STRA